MKYRVILFISLVDIDGVFLQEEKQGVQVSMPTEIEKVLVIFFLLKPKSFPKVV